MTKYVVLRQRDSDVGPDSSVFEAIATLDAANARAAVAAAVKNNGATSGSYGATAGSYVATPVRSFKTVTVTSESTVHIKIT